MKKEHLGFSTKGFGFIAPEHDGNGIFAHTSGLNDGIREMKACPTKLKMAERD